MNRQLLAVLAVALMTSQIASAYDEVTNPSTMVLLAHRQLTAGTANNAGEIGMWEYVYDFYGNGVSQMARWGLYGYDPTAIVNQSPISAGWSGYGPLNQQWNLAAKSNHAYSSFWGNFTTMGSYAGAYVDPAKGMYGDLNTWVVPTIPVVEDYGIVNTWHAPADYAYGTTKRPGDLILTGERMGIVFEAGASATPIDGLLHTFRLVHPNSPGDVTWWSYTFNNGGVTAIATIQGPAVPPPEPPLGSFNGDMDVDEIDIDLLGDAIRTGSVNFALFDISGDGVTNVPDGNIDINDLDFLVRFLVDTTMGVGTGSEYGDFNLDGLVDTTDLTRLATYFGPGTLWAEGNANRNIDLMIDTTDLTILGTYFGFDASVDVIPEPMTLSLLVIGSAALLRGRR